LHDRIKVNGKTGNLGTSISITRSGSNLIVKTHGIGFSKRYLKYLSKKFLKKHSLRDWLHVIASDKNTYQLRYFNINQAEEEAAEDDE
jgi:large subunit ribosomal protein L22e